MEQTKRIKSLINIIVKLEIVKSATKVHKQDVDRLDRYWTKKQIGKMQGGGYIYGN